VKGDVANPNDLDRLYQTVAAKKGKLDILFANAGIADSITGRISCRPELFSVTRNSLIVAGEASRGHYIFQLVDNGPDHRLARPRCPTQRRSRFAMPDGPPEKTHLTYEYLKYVIDPMFRCQ
jgi:NAD(P)-dependent dehydrogenase (short-subunit alcohol dehydrogenase family)